MAEIFAVPDIVLAPATEQAAKSDVAKLITPHDESDPTPLPVELNITSKGLQAFLNEKHIAMVEQLLYKSGDARMAALHAVDSAEVLVEFLAFSDMATLKHFLSLDNPVMRDAFVQGLHHPVPVIEAVAQPSPVAIVPAPVENTTPPTTPVLLEGSVINVGHEDQRVDDHVQVPAIGAMMMDPGDGDDAGDGAGEADADGGYGGDGIGPDPEGEAGDFGGEIGSGDAAPAASEPEATTPSSQESPATETPAGQNTGDATPTDAGSGAEHQFDSSSPHTNAPSDTPGQTNSIRWEEDDEALSPPTQPVQTTTVSTTTEAGRNLTDMVLDLFDPPVVYLTGGGSDAAMPTVGSFLRTVANGAAAIIVAGGFVAAAFFAATSSRHSRSSRDGSHGGHDGDPSHALVDDGQVATDNATDQANSDDGLAFDAAAFIAQLRQSHTDGAMDPRLDDPAFLALLNRLGSQIIAEMPREVILQNTLDASPAPDLMPNVTDTPGASLTPPAPPPNPALETVPVLANAPATPDPVADPTPPAATLYVEFALAAADAGDVRGILDAAGNWVAQNASGLSLHVAGFEVRPELRLAANAVMHIMVNMEVRAGESRASGGHISMSDIQEITRGLHTYCEAGNGAAAQGLHLAFMGLDVMSGEIVPDSGDAGAGAENVELTLTGVPAAELAAV